MIDDQDMHSNDLLQLFSKIIPIFGGMTAIVVAFSWWIGRTYAKAYFGYYDIPIHQIDYSIWDYGEIGFSYFNFVVFICGNTSLAFIIVYKSHIIKAIFDISEKTLDYLRIILLIIIILFSAYLLFTNKLTIGHNNHSTFAP